MNNRISICLLSLALGGLTAHADEPRIISEGNHSYIHVGANFLLCGALTITPTTSAPITLVSYRYEPQGTRTISYPQENRTVEVPVLPIITKLGEIVLHGSALSQEYQWAGFGDRHFRIYAYRPDEAQAGNFANPLPIAEYVTISSRHNLPCVIPAFGGPGVPKEPLNMVSP